MSYAIPPDFVKDFIDSRLCPEVTNVIINVAQPRTYFGIVEFTNPITAHIDYDNDQRIIDIIAHGVRRTEEGEDLEGSTSENIPATLACACTPKSVAVGWSATTAILSDS